MDYLVYCKTQDETLRSEFKTKLKGVSESVLSNEHLITVFNSYKAVKIPDEVLYSLEELLQDKKLAKEDEIYLFYPDDGQIGVWFIKRKGRIRIRKWPRE